MVLLKYLLGLSKQVAIDLVLFIWKILGAGGDIKVDIRGRVSDLQEIIMLLGRQGYVS